MELKISDIKKYMYVGRFKNKNEFIEHIKETRLKRKSYKFTSKYKNRLIERYLHLVPKSNFIEIENILFKAFGKKPSFYQVSHYVGDVGRTYYDGSVRDYNCYSRSCNYSANVHQFKLFSQRKLRIEISEVDGIYNLECYKLKTIKGTEIYKAKWIKRQGNSFNFSIVNGFIAIMNNESYHGQTIKESMVGLTKKLKRKIKQELKYNQDITLPLFRKLTGACEIGCNNFIQKHNLGTSIKLNELIELLDKNSYHNYSNILKKCIVN